MSETNWNLVPLTPEYIEDEHGGYVAELENALKNDEIRNIALSGPYGVGKSSILRELARRLKGRVVELSLSTLAATRPPESEKLDEAVPIQATTTTNRIQQEIVKQLLYRMDPAKARASRFHRIERFDWKRERVAALLFGLFISIVFLLTGWTNQIASTYKALTNLDMWAHLFILALATGILWVLATVAVFILRFLLYGKIQIKQLSAGTASVTLDDNSVSYFDQYLDEIVYFFTVTDHDVVILEDIDRFNDSQIFETLRALNTLLNASPQVGKRIRFIYAIKDSIFDHEQLNQEGRQAEPGASSVDDSVHAEVVRANRTKFFDLIIPVVPFVAHHNARDLLNRLLGDDHGVNVGLVDLAAKYIPDMRLLKNVCNEFIVFRDHIISADSEQLKLDETELFAMMLYKNTHLADFEKIRLGTSNLDKLYKLSRRLIDRGIQLTLDDMKRHEHETYEAVVDHYDEDDIFQEDPTRLSVSGTYFDTALYANHRASLEELRSADMSDLIKNPTLLVELEKSIHSSKEGPARNGEEKECFFASRAKELLKSDLAYRLVHAGFINRNFTLYASRFYGDRVTTSAMNFIIHHVQTNSMAPHLKLMPADIDAVIQECGKNKLEEPALYNISILDRLLATDLEAALIMIRSLASFDLDAWNFLEIYLAEGEQRLQLLLQLTSMTSWMLEFLLSLENISDADRIELVNAALSGLKPPSEPWLRRPPRKQQDCDRAITNYLRQHSAEFSVLTTDESYEQAQGVVELFYNERIRLPRLTPLSTKTRQEFIWHNLYDITHENLTIIRGSGRSLALDAIQGGTETIYDYMLRNLGDYLRAVDGFSCTVDKAEQFIPVLEDLLKQAENQSALEPSLIESVVERAAPECRVQNLADISDKVWQTLALHKRFPGTFNNVSRYVTIFGIDKNLASLLAKAGEITEVESAEVDKKALLAKSIRTAQDHLPDASLRESLVASLKQSSPRDIEER